MDENPRLVGSYYRERNSSEVDHSVRELALLRFFSVSARRVNGLVTLPSPGAYRHAPPPFSEAGPWATWSLVQHQETFWAIDSAAL
jgi:hypothetical protein